jgi:hypothetical protein
VETGSSVEELAWPSFTHSVYAALPPPPGRAALISPCSLLEAKQSAFPEHHP